MTNRVLTLVLLATGCAMIIVTPAQSRDRSFEQASADFIQRYLQEWSGPAPAALAYMDQIYPDRVDFYGKVLDHSALMNIKRRFAARWPDRALTLRPDSLKVTCDTRHLCAAQAIFDWHYRSQERQANSTGTASLQLELQDGMAIVAETGSVISSSKSPPLALLQSLPPPPPIQQPNTVQSSPPDPDKEFSIQDLPTLRTAFFAHAADQNWITDWLAQKRGFSGQGTFTGFTEHQASTGPAGVLRTFNFATASGPVSCLNPDDATSLTVGEKVSIRGVITIFIDDVMYIGQCSIQPT